MRIPRNRSDELKPNVSKPTDSAVAALRTRAGATGKNELKAGGVAQSAHAFTVNQFCARWQISRPLFYRMLRDGTGPDTVRVGDRIRITSEAEAAFAARSKR